MANKGIQLSTNQLVLIRQLNLRFASVGNGAGPEGSSWFRRHRAHRNYQDCQGSHSYVRPLPKLSILPILSLVYALSNI